MAKKSKVELELQIRLDRQHELQNRLQDLLDTDPLGTIGDMLNLTIATLAKVYPPDLSAEDILKIKDSYPLATKLLIAERAMAEEGLQYAIASSVELARVALDYSPLSYCKDDIASDEFKANKAQDTLSTQLAQSFERAIASGMTPFGASACIILTGTYMGYQRNVPWTKLARPLFDAFSVSMGSR